MDPLVIRRRPGHVLPCAADIPRNDAACGQGHRSGAAMAASQPTWDSRLVIRRAVMRTSLQQGICRDTRPARIRPLLVGGVPWVMDLARVLRSAGLDVVIWALVGSATLAHAL